MTKEDFIKMFSDVKVQQFETDTILSKQEIMDMVKQFTNSLNMGLIYYEHNVVAMLLFLPLIK